VHVVELRAHHRREHAAPPVGRQHADHGDARGGYAPARHRQLEGERARAADRGSVLPRRVHALRLEHVREPL
jgi:hypothetical protein